MKKVHDGKFCGAVYLILVVIGIASQTFLSGSIAYGGIVVILMFLELLFLYLTRYPCPSWKSVFLRNWIEDIIFLGIWNTGEYFFCRKKSMSEWNQAIKCTAGITMTAIVVVVMTILGVSADSVFSLVVYCFLSFVRENLYLLLIIGLLGFCYSVVIYNFVTGLDRGILEENPHWYYKTIGASRGNKSSFTLEVLLNDKSILAILGFISIFNVFLFICCMIYFWQEEGSRQIFIYEEQFYALLALLAVEGSLLYIVRVKLLTGRKPQALELHWTLAMLTAVSCSLPWVLAVIMYIIEIYNKLILWERSGGVYVLVVIILFLNEYRKSCKRVYRTTDKELVTFRTVSVLLAVLVVWNSAVFPFYNVNLYEMKYDMQEVQRVQPEELNISQMAKAGKYAIPVLIRLLEWEMPYGDEGKTVSQEAEEQLLQIYYQEIDRDSVNDIMTQGEWNRLEALLNFMNEEASYGIGFRGYCREKLRGVILRRNAVR
ncbi:MAG: hypothetical protein K2K74_17955 [Lachnospiraceae bacterium]|nr:hypothetical protein [Lachnospiraceae bacterium]